MLIRVNGYRWDAEDRLIARVLLDRGGSEELRLSSEDAEKVEKAWTQSQFDLERYARLPAHFPAPEAIPVEVTEPTGH
jgi:hypothetical protein